MRADGTIAYAENPPKKYQDIYPLNFDNDPEGICREVKRVVDHWIGHGVKIFRVDNPHTKPVAFWEWLIAEVTQTDPDVLFLAEAFTKPPMMHTLGQGRLHPVLHLLHLAQRAWELEEYLTELSQRDRRLPAAQLLRQHPGHPARLPAVRRPAGVQDPRRARRDDVAVLGRLLRLRAATSTSRSGPAARSTSTRRSTSTARATGRRPSASGRTPDAATSPGSTRSAATTPRCTSCATCACTRRQRADHRVLSKTRSGDDTRARRGQPRPARACARRPCTLDMPALGLRAGTRPSRCATS